MKKKVVIELPWPPRELSPNCRVDRYSKNKHFQSYKLQAYAATLKAMKGKTAQPAERTSVRPTVNVQYCITPPDKRARDEDNFFATMKAAQDGIALALKVNDCFFHLRELTRDGADRLHPKVVVTLDWQQVREQQA